MGLYAHSIHLLAADKDTGRFLAGHLLKSSQSLVVATPYGRWITVYLPMGLSYKDVADLPTAQYVELNCYDGEGFDVRLYAQDRLAYLFESGCGDLSEVEDKLMEVAAGIWREEHPDEERETVEETASTHDISGDEEVDPRQGKDFWSLAEDVQNEYLARAKASPDYGAFLEGLGTSHASPDPAPFAHFLEGAEATPADLKEFLDAAATRLAGPPKDDRHKAVLARRMDGREYSDNAADYLAAVAGMLGVRGALWSLEALQQKLADKIDRRIVPIDALDETPPA